MALPGQEMTSARMRFAHIGSVLESDAHRPGFTAGFAAWDGEETVDALIARADVALLTTRYGPAGAAAGRPPAGHDAPRRPVGAAAGLGLDAARREVAGDLHDCAVFLLVAMHRDLAVPGGDPIAVARTALRAAAEDIRRLSHGLGRATASDGGLAQALEALCDAATRRDGVLAAAEIEPGVLGGVFADLAYVAAVELVENCLNHARATNVRVVLRDGGADRVELVVSDDGRGMGAARDSPEAEPGMGLELLRRRVVDAGGTLTVSAPPGGGTMVTVRLPRDEPA